MDTEPARDPWRVRRSPGCRRCSVPLVHLTFPADPDPDPDPDTVTTAALDGGGWNPYPLGDDVVSGDPDCRIKVLRTVGVRTPVKVVAFFTAEPSTFARHFVNDEAFVLLEGHIALTLDTGERYEMRAGDAMSLPGGREGVCEVFEPSRKFTVVTSA
ncbi:cupin domain-containing protein [Streptomyces sp. NPDC047108]|uniref:cupin domain-containing protein n=1 Tax=Streptomyces sp. NPDC047108 TaxID=3155025 RepID=UPI0033D53ACA